MFTRCTQDSRSSVPCTLLPASLCNLTATTSTDCTAFTHPPSPLLAGLHNFTAMADTDCTVLWLKPHEMHMIGQQALQLVLRYTAIRRERRSQDRHIARPTAQPEGSIVLGGGGHRGDPATPRQFALDSKVTTLLGCVLSIAMSGIMWCSAARATKKGCHAVAVCIGWCGVLAANTACSERAQQVGSTAPPAHPLPSRARCWMRHAL